MIKKNNLRVIGVPKEAKRDKEVESLFKETKLG